MRTTLTLDHDIVAMIQRLRKRTGSRDKQIVNEALRRGLAQMVSPESPQTMYRTPSVSLGRCLQTSLDDVADVLAWVEGESYR